MRKSVLDNITTLEEFHKEIYRQQEENHREHYCAIHGAVVKYWNEGNCETYM